MKVSKHQQQDDDDHDDEEEDNSTKNNHGKNNKTKRKNNPRLNEWPEDAKSCSSSTSTSTTNTHNNNNNPFFLWLWLVRIVQNWTYSYMNVVLDQGAKQKSSSSSTTVTTTTTPASNSDDEDRKEDGNYHLTFDDLYVVPRTMKSKVLVSKFNDQFNKVNNTTNSTGAVSHSSTNNDKAKADLFWTLWNLSLPTMIPAGWCEFIVVLCSVILPLLVRELLHIVETNPQNRIVGEALPYSMGIFVISLVNGLHNHRHRHLALKTGIVIRSATINAIYEHILQLDPQVLSSLHSGQVTNLVAVDTQKLFEVTQEFHLIWALPLSILLVSYFLIQTLGTATLVGVLTLVGFVPLIQYVTKQMLLTRAIRAQFTDQRITTITNMLQGIRVTKLNHYESNYYERIMNVRQAEMKYLQKEMAIWAVTLFMTVVSPVLASGAAFATYVLLDPGRNVLTASKTFGVILLFGALRFPINYAGRLIGKAAQALSALQRISKFLKKPLRRTKSDPPPNDHRNSQEGFLNKDDDDENKTKSAIACTSGSSSSGGVKSSSVSLIGKGLLIETNGEVVVLDDDEKNDDDNAAPPLELVNACFQIGRSSEQDNDDDGGGSTGAGSKNRTDEEAPMNNDTGRSFQSARSLLTGGPSLADDGFTVSTFDFSIHKGEVLAICGPVGSGKSTLINGILEEAEAIGETSIRRRGNISYVPQTPFIMNQTLRDNILFGLEFDELWYNRVLDACCLRPDIVQLGQAGDLTEIGERGVTLSGGQKQRVSMARAVYALRGVAAGQAASASQSSPSSPSPSSSSPPSLYILDDPFSALDSGTSKMVFENLIGAPNALLKDVAVLLVTHASHFITNRSVDRILLIVDGRNRFLGTWEELSSFHPGDKNTKRAVEHIKSSIREEEEEEEQNEAGASGGDTVGTKPDDSHKESQDLDLPSKDKKSEDDGRLVQKEEREHGLSSIKTWLLWFQRAGGLYFITLQFLLLALDRGIYVANEWFIARWTSAADGTVNILGKEFPSQSDGLQAQSQYLKVYVTLVTASAIATALRSEWAVTGGSRAARNVFSGMLASVLRAPMSYFETVPMGRILNRFTYDTDVNDVTLTQVMSMFMISCSWYIAGVSIQCSILPYSALAVFPVSAMYWYLMLHYRYSGPDLQRLDALSRSPVQSMVAECLEGSTSIRIFQQDMNFTRRFRAVADTNSSALLNFVSAQRWLGARMELLGSTVVLLSSTLVVVLNEKLGLEPGLVGMLIMWSANFTITLNFMVDNFSETEAAITAIERVDAMANLPKERPAKTDSKNLPPQKWPENGSLSFENVSLRYREGLPLALDGLSFQIPAGKACGVVGRTGAGKSSITVALFRLVEIESGRISLDGIDLATLGLSDVRGRDRGMTIIPQDPFLAGATLRECLDPFHQHSDSEIVDALKSVRLGTSSASAADEATLMSSKLEEGGSNYSVGERQLLNLARALLSQPKLLVLDEATASIDGETDAFIQKMLRTRFPDTTLVTIAHRLNTIMDYDCILVMEAGHAVEFGSPASLLENPGGVLSELVDATGAESSKALRDMANLAANTKTKLRPS